MGASVSQQLVRVILKTLEYGCEKSVLAHVRPFSTEIATTAFLERHYPYEAQESRFRFFIDDTFVGRFCCSVYGYSRNRVPVLCTTELEENDDIIICWSCSGIIRRPQFRP